MLFSQSTTTFHNYFPELSLAGHEPEPEPAQSIPRLASEILRSAQARRTGNTEGEKKSSDRKPGSEAATGGEGRNSWNQTPKFLLAGAVSTVISRTCLAPLERVKLECIVHGPKLTWPTIVKLIWASEGLGGFWRGNALNLFRMVPFKSLSFVLYDMYLHHIDNRAVANLDRLVGGGISGVVATVVCLPLDTIRTRLMSPGGEALGGVPGCVVRMVRDEGFTSLYRGLTPALISMGPSCAVFYSVYDILKCSYLSRMKRTLGDDNGNDVGVARTLVFGAIAGAVAETVTYPLEVVRRQLQLQRSANLGLAAAFVMAVEKDGVGSLYAGWFPSTLQVLPSAALSYLFYEMMKSILKIS